MSRLFLYLALFPLAIAAQAPRIGQIDFYGLHYQSAESLLAVLGIHTGDPLPPSKGDLEERLGEVPGVVDARVEAVCCQGAQATLFIGIEEQGAAHFETRAAPAGDATLPENVMEQYREWAAARRRAQDAEARRLESGFTAFAARNPRLLREVLRDGGESDQRAAAAAVARFAPKPAEVAGDLDYALRDADETVRANAAASLGALVLEARKQRQAAPRIAPGGLVDMLNSIVLSDRLRAAEALAALTGQPNAAALALLRERALPALAEMARWQTAEYAQSAFLLLGRALGVAEAELQAQWRGGDRETVLRKAAEKR